MAQPNEFNQKIIDEFRANGGKVGGMFEGRRMILITTTGAKSGEQTTTPLVYFPEGDKYVVIASMGGAPKNPAWYHNMVANPGVTIDVGQGEFAATANEVKGTERDAIYAKVAAEMTAFADYEAKTTRKIPVMVLSKA